MKFDAPPERIWLQLHGDCEPEYPVECGEETTWCWERIFPKDVEYVRAPQWQFIDTVPLETDVFVWADYYDTPVLTKAFVSRSDEKTVLFEGLAKEQRPTHWTHIPEPPNDIPTSDRGSTRS